jgi:hypothetical protein
MMKATSGGERSQSWMFVVAAAVVLAVTINTSSYQQQQQDDDIVRLPRVDVIVNLYDDSTDGDCMTEGTTTCNLRAAFEAFAERDDGNVILPSARHHTLDQGLGQLRIVTGDLAMTMSGDDGPDQQVVIDGGGNLGRFASIVNSGARLTVGNNFTFQNFSNVMSDTLVATFFGVLQGGSSDASFFGQQQHWSDVMYTKNCEGMMVILFCICFASLGVYCNRRFLPVVRIEGKARVVAAAVAIFVVVGMFSRSVFAQNGGKCHGELGGDLDSSSE